MKKKMQIVILACILLSGIIVYVFAAGGKKPYKDLNASEILSAAVRLVPPDKTVKIVELEELAGYLNDVVIFNMDNSYTEYDGQGVIFTLIMADGTQTEIMAYNPFLVIDGIGYKTVYEPCEALNRYANRLLNEENAIIILKEPPALAVINDNISCDTLLGTYSWQYPNNDGTTTGIEADSAHPLDCKDLLVPLETKETTAILHFHEEPDAIISVQCWSDENWSDQAAKSEGETVTFNGNELELKPGGYIYEVKAEWSTENGYGGGTANYSFYVITDTYQDLTQDTQQTSPEKQEK